MTARKSETSSAARVAEHRKAKEAKGMKWRGLWVYPAVWDRVKRAAEKANKQHEKEARDGNSDLAD